MSTLLLCAPGAAAAALAAGGPAAGVSGVVRDAAGVAQMGALVQVLGNDAAPVGVAFTDAHGRYLIGGLRAGNYRVRASATLFVPATQSNLRLQSGATLVVNLTLAALFDAAQWLPANRRGANEPADDWKWTLRSAANRPILQWTNADDAQGSAATGADGERTPARAEIHGQVEIAGESGRFGQGDAQGVLSLRRKGTGGMEAGVRVETGSARAGSPFDEFAVAYGGADAAGNVTELSLRALNHPELTTRSAPGGLEVLQLASGRRVRVGTQIAIEAGSELDALRLGATAIVLRPFLRIEAQPSDAWAIALRLASDPDLQSLAEVHDRHGEPPVAARVAGRLRTATGTHTELALAHKNGRSTVEFACFYDDLQHTTLRGGSTRFSTGPVDAGLARRLPAHETAADQVSGGRVHEKEVPEDEALVDPFSGSLRGLGPGVQGAGGRIRVRTPLTPTVRLEAEYALGDAFAAPSGAAANYTEMVHSLRPQHSSAVSAALDGRLPATGTKLRVSYRAQPGRTVTAVNPFGSGRGDAYLGVAVRQPIRWAGHLPEGFDATLDLVNLLAQGYQPFLSADGRTLYLAQMPRTLQAGINFSF